MFPMGRALLLLAVVGLAGSLLAADPIIGTWKLNISKSKFAALMQELPLMSLSKIVVFVLADFFFGDK